MAAPRFAVRRSSIHQRGVFARIDLPAHTRLIEYRGSRIDIAAAAQRNAALLERGETYLFQVNERYFIDGQAGGNSARYINHSCAPNCEAVIYVDINGDEIRDKVWIETLRDVRAGEELCFDYDLSLPFAPSAELLRIWACRCAAPQCRGSLLRA